AGPGDVVLAERLTYPGARRLSDLLHLTLKGVDIDGEGIRPDSFEKACRALAPKLLYCTPTIQNPTASVMPPGRRREIARIAAAHGVALVEDDTYGLLSPERPRPLAAHAPDSGFYIASLSKTIAPGLRVAYLLCPRKHAERVAAAIRSTTWMAAPLMAEIAAVWIEDGTADASLGKKRREIGEREKLAGSRPHGHRIRTPPTHRHPGP